MSGWREGISDQLDAAIDPLWPVLEAVLEATIEIVYGASAREEREAVVRWLRGAGVNNLADGIEAGEHRKEGT